MKTFREPLPDISASAAALADPSRAAMCGALMDGRAWTVGELATYCGLARSTASEHVSLLVARGVLSEVRQGRHRYVRLVGEDVARIVEGLSVLSDTTVPTPPSLGAHRAGERFRDGRTCYWHLAGRLGVELAGRLHRRHLIDDDFQPTTAGRSLFADWTIPAVARGMPCMDSTERRFHLAGTLGAAVCATFFARGWIERVESTRAVQLTPDGTEYLDSIGLAPHSL